jgi:hypothetical protein
MLALALALVLVLALALVCVAQIQVVTNLKGVPVHWAGPFLGVMADIDVFRESNAIGALSLDPDVEARYKLLGDKAYVKDEAKWPVITPAKANSREMKADSEAADAKATVVNWYRSTVEHTFAYLKRYAFLNSQLRCKMNTSSFKLSSLVHVNSAKCIGQENRTPHSRGGGADHRTRFPYHSRYFSLTRCRRLAIDWVCVLNWCSVSAEGFG